VRVWLAAFVFSAGLLCASSEVARGIGLPETAATEGSILFERNEGSDDCYGSIWIMGVDGSNQRPFIASGAGDCSPAWSSSGTQIAFSSRRNGAVSAIFAANADGTNVRQLTHSRFDDFNPDWSPDGSQIAFERLFPSSQGGDYELFVMNSDGSALHRLPGGPGFDGTPKWSPDGRSLLFASDRPKRGRPTCRECSALYLMNPDGTTLRRITKRTVDSITPAWSSDGSSIAWSRHNSLYLMNADSTSAHMLASIGELPSWSADGARIAYAANGAIMVIGRDGTGRLQLTASENASYPAWQPTATEPPRSS
jgi:Tol biopolymer transport system component